MTDQGTPTDPTLAIREAAYRIWQSEGCPEGCDLEHWLRAEREVLMGEAPAVATVTASPGDEEISASVLKLKVKEETKRRSGG
jgi:hypothetical protein